MHRRLMIPFLMLLLIACVPQVAQPVPTNTAPAATSVIVATVASTAIITPTITSVLAPAPTPGATGTVGTAPGSTTVPSPEPTAGPIKQILIEFGPAGGDGRTSYEGIIGFRRPDVILYTDGQVFISGTQYGADVSYVQKKLTVPEICDLLQRIRATGFFNVPEPGGNDSNDPIYVEQPDEFEKTACGYHLSVSGKPSKRVFILGPTINKLVPEVKAALVLMKEYHPAGMKAFVSDRIIVRVERQRSEGWPGPMRPSPEPWPADLPSLAALLQDEPESRDVVFEGQSAARVFKLLAPWDAAMFTDKGQDFFLTGRGLLPHETLNYYGQYSLTQSFDLPFTCDK